MSESNEKVLIKSEEQLLEEDFSNALLPVGSATIIYFFCYAVIGWSFESVYSMIIEGGWERRGYLLGPYCPIYGFGAVLILRYINPKINNPVKLFVASFIGCSVLEYFASVFMENILNVRLWNYSDKLLNIDGRVCFLNSFLFGVIALLLVYVLHPRISVKVSKLRFNVRKSVAMLVIFAMLTDFMLSFCVVGYSGKPVLEPVLDFFMQM